MWQTLEVSSTLVIPVMLHTLPYMVESLLSATAKNNTLTKLACYLHIS